MSGGLLLQTPDAIGESSPDYSAVTEREPTLEEVTDLMFAWKVVRHVKSNAIVLAHKLAMVGVGAGQMNRVASVQLAVEKAAKRARGSVLASDAFFPFADGVEAAAKAGVTFENTSKVEPLVVLRYFGPDVNPDAPALGAYRKNRI